MKNYNGMLVAIIIATTLLIFIPISAYTDWVITQDIDNSSDAAHSTINNVVVVPDTSSVKTETWELILDGGRGHANLTLLQKQDGTITADGNWGYTYQGSYVSGPYFDAPVIIAGSSISIKASGIATNPSAPQGYKTSPFTLSVSGTAFNGQGNGTFTMIFQTVEWPNNIVGSWEGTRTSGSGITAETAKAKAMPWLLLLLSGGPVANAGIDQNVIEGETVILNGSLSHSDGGKTLTYKWNIVSKPLSSAATLSDSSIVNPSFTADIVGLYLVSLIVNDGIKDSKPDYVIVKADKLKRTLEFQVVDAEYSKQFDKIIMISSEPKQLHIFDPLSGDNSSINLPLIPTCVSVGPDGLFAAVGHDGWVSYINLNTITLEKTIAVSTDVLDIVLAGNGYIYAFPARDQWERIRCVNITSEIETLHTGGSIYAGTLAKLHPDGLAIYGADNGLSPSDIEKYDITSGTAEYLYDSPYHGDYAMCGDLWFSDDGLRIFTRCGNVFRTSNTQALDMIYNGSLSELGLITHLSHSISAGRVAVIPGENFWPSPSPDDTVLQLYDYTFLVYENSIALPTFSVGQNTYPGHGKFVFFNGDGTQYYVIIQADSTSGLLYDHAVVVY